MNSRFFKLCRVYSNSLEIKNVGVEPFISLTSRKIRKRHEFVISELSETLLQILQSSPVFSIGDSTKQSTTECDKQVPSTNNFLDALSWLTKWLLFSVGSKSPSAYSIRSYWAADISESKPLHSTDNCTPWPHPLVCTRLELINRLTFCVLFSVGSKSPWSY